MSFVTLQRYLLRGDDKQEVATRRVIALLLQGISLHAVEGEPADAAQFRSDMERIQASLDEEASPDVLLVSAGAAVQALQAYNQRTAIFIKRQSNDFRKMIAMLAETIITIGTGNQQALTNLKDIELKLEGAGALEDVESVKQKLDECLQSVREEAARQKLQSEAAIQNLQRSLDDVQNSMSGGSNLDAATGLPGREAAERAMQEAMKAPGRKYIATFVVSRLQAINARFGYAVGDEVIRVCKEHLEKNLSKSDRLFRWQGPTLLALMERPEPIDRVRNDIKRIAEVRIEKTFTIQGRTVLLPISVTWSAVGLIPPLANMVKQIQTFVASQSPGGISDV